jgi:uncharacterized small protein (DUF1192 family)
MMSSVGATDVVSTGGFDLTGALQEGYSPAQIADYLATKKNFDVAGARAEGYTDQQILAHLTGNTGFSAGVKRFVESAGSSIKGLAQIAGLADTERLRAERQAAEIASANNPYIGGAAEFAGAIADPVNLPALAVAPLRGATLAATMAKQGAAQGAFGGLLEPVLKEGADTGLFSTERAKGAALGTFGGAVLGGALGKGAESLINFLTKKADVPLADVPAGKAATDTAISDVAKLVDEPVTNERVFRDERYDYKPLSIDEKTLIDQRIALLEGDINKLSTERVKVDTTETAEKQVASLLRGEEKAPVQEATGLPSTNRGLVSPSKATPAKQTPALFKAAEKPPEAPAKGVTPISEAPQVAALFKGYSLDADIKAKQAEIEQLRSVLAKDQEVKMLQVTKQLPQPLTQVETKTAARFNEQPVLTKQGEVPPAALTAPPPRAATVATQQVTPEVQAVLERNGFKTMEEANAALGKSPLERAGMAGSAGSMRTDPYLRLAEDVPFGTAPEKFYSPTYRGRIDADPVSVDAAINDMHMKAVAAAGKAGRELRGKGQMGGSLAATEKLGEKAAAQMTSEEGSVLDWALQNADKSWNREEIAAFMPQYREAQQFLGAQLDEYNRLRAEGLLTPEMEQTIMHRSQVPLGVMSIFQGQRSKASMQLNAFKTAYNSYSAGKEVKGFATPGRTCT